MPHSPPSTHHVKSPNHHHSHIPVPHYLVDVASPFDKKSHLYHPEIWAWHDIYNKQLSYDGSIVTRSQTAFNRVQIGEEEMKLFGDKVRHHPPNLPHLMMTMKDGIHGAVPRTIITRSMANQLEINPTLSKTLDAHKTFEPLLSLTHSFSPHETHSGFTSHDIKKEVDSVDINVKVESLPTKIEKPLGNNIQTKCFCFPVKSSKPVTSSNSLIRESSFSQESQESLGSRGSSTQENASKPSIVSKASNPFFISSETSPEPQSQTGEEAQERPAPSTAPSESNSFSMLRPTGRDFLQRSSFPVVSKFRKF